MSILHKQINTLQPQDEIRLFASPTFLFGALKGFRPFWAKFLLLAWTSRLQELRHATKLW